jgi:diaminopimelate epimerase
MRFTKMQGSGNDYVYLDCFQQPAPDDPRQLARRMSDRHFGIGADGLILIGPSRVADARMRMFNADGSAAEMCGNGIRCVAKYVYDHGICRKPSLRIETDAGIRSADLQITAGRARRVRVDMGEPILQPDRIPTTLPGNPSLDGRPVVGAKLSVGGEVLEVACVSMGNPHVVTYVDQLGDDRVLRIGPRLESDPHFPNRTNVEFVQALSPTEVCVRVWERGSGETLACGTGASAVCVAGVLTGRTHREILAHLRGGDLELHWADDNHVYLTGPAVEVFSGQWNEEEQ